MLGLVTQSLVLFVEFFFDSAPITNRALSAEHESSNMECFCPRIMKNKGAIGQIDRERERNQSKKKNTIERIRVE